MKQNKGKPFKCGVCNAQGMIDGQKCLYCNGHGFYGPSSEETGKIEIEEIKVVDLGEF